MSKDIESPLVSRINEDVAAASFFFQSGNNEEP